MRQQSFFQLDNRKTYGGEKGRAKRKRPLNSRKAVHITQRSSRARDLLALSRRKREIRRLLQEKARDYGVILYRIEILNTHYHLLARFTKPDLFRDFLRVVNGLVARLMTGAKKGNPKGKYWDEVAFTRIVEGGRDWRYASHYLFKNHIEAEHGYEGRLAYEYECRQNAGPKASQDG